MKVAYGYACGAVEQAPPCLDEMLYVATERSRPFRFVWVGFYVVNGKPLVGEMTFFPTGAGNSNHRASDASSGPTLGSAWSTASS